MRATGVENRAENWSDILDSDVATLCPDVAEMIDRDQALEESTINLIASASYAPKALRQIQGSHLVNRSPMGWLGNRIVGKCEYLDALEELAVTRCKRVFGAEYANVQAISSTIANVAVLRAILPAEGGRILSFAEAAGGHVSHGGTNHITADHCTVQSFGVAEDGFIDFEAVYQQAEALSPHVIIAGASSYPREIDFLKLRDISDRIGAILIADIAHVAGLIVAGFHANPVPIADIATTSTQKTLCGPRNGAFVFAREQYGANIDAAIFPGLQGPACPDLFAARAAQLDLVTRPSFRDLMERVLANARAFGSGLVDAGIELFTGGTDSHIVVALAPTDWTKQSLVQVLDRYSVTGNAVTVGSVGCKPQLGFRFGLTAMTIRNIEASVAMKLGTFIGEILQGGNTENIDPAMRNALSDIASTYPVPSFN